MNSGAAGWILTGIFIIVVAGLVIGALYYLWVFLAPLLRKWLIKLNSERAQSDYSRSLRKLEMDISCDRI